VLVDLATLVGVSMGRPEEAIPYGRRPLAGARGVPRLEAAANRALGNVLVRTGDLAGGIPLLERALALAEAADDPAEAAECCAFLGVALHFEGKLHRAYEIYTRQLGLARRCQDPFQMRHVHASLALMLVGLGRLEEAAAVIARAEEAVGRIASPEPMAVLHLVRGLLAFQAGDYPAAQTSIGTAIDTFRRLGPANLVWDLGFLGAVEVALGRRAQALACLEEIDALCATLPPGMGVRHAYLLGGLTAAQLGDRERAARYYAWTEGHEGNVVLFLVPRVRGALATLLGDWEAAERHLDAAEALARREGLRPELGRTLADRGALALAEGRSGGGERAREAFAEALALFEGMGMAGEAARVRERLAGLAGRGAATRPALPAGLSAREAEVLRLVAAGKSNREIAEALVVAERTVANHVASILNKTGSENRAAAAAFAIRHGLA
jgi:DNA-binding CsgD family transcriptional regulator